MTKPHLYLDDLWTENPDWGNRYAFTAPPKEGEWPGPFENFVEIKKSGLLVPRLCRLHVWGTLTDDLD